MRALLLGVAVSLLGAASIGCATYHVAVPSVQGRAFVIEGGMFGSKMLNCDATGGAPVCYPVTKVEAAAAK